MWPSYLIYVLQYVLLKRFATWDVKLNLVKWYGFIFPREIDYHNFKFASPKKKLYATLDNDNIIIYWAIYHFKGLLLATFWELKKSLSGRFKFQEKKIFFWGVTGVKHTQKKTILQRLLGPRKSLSVGRVINRGLEVRLSWILHYFMLEPQLCTKEEQGSESPLLPFEFPGLTVWRPFQFSTGFDLLSAKLAMGFKGATIIYLSKSVQTEQVR